MTTHVLRNVSGMVFLSERVTQNPCNSCNVRTKIHIYNSKKNFSETGQAINSICSLRVHVRTRGANDAIVPAQAQGRAARAVTCANM